jgi:monoamine oxidase
MTDVDVVVVGAGVAGLAAAAETRRRGRSCALLEAGGRIGGRAWTVHEPALGGVAFDHGASWLHDADHNPLREIAEAHGDELIDSSARRIERTFVAGRPASEAELADYSRAEEIFHRELSARDATGEADISVAEAVDRLREIPWITTVETWETSIINAADAADISLLDWQRIGLQGRNMLIRTGLGSFVRDRLGPAAMPVQLNTAVRAVRWDGARVVVDTAAGSLSASSCIITVSTGVLQAGMIRFTPALPAEVQAAIDGLPMGLLTKIAMRTEGKDRFDLPAFCSLDQQVLVSGGPMMTFSAWPFGLPTITGFVGGRTAWELAAAGPAASEAFAREQLRSLFGSRADRAFAGATAVVTGWADDKLTCGAYCYARPGDAGARAELGRNFAGGRLLFAGEACHETLAGTVAGAWVSGCRAARAAA